jgi:hypothetical protein
MKTFMTMRVVGGLVMTALAVDSTAATPKDSLAANAIAVEVRHGHCEAATRLINTDAQSNDRQSAFITGRLLDEGICVQPDRASAAHFFARAAELGDRNGALDFATKVGLGEGVEQDYQRAGDLCRAAGVDPQSRLSGYALGYACTVRGVAGKLLRQALPTGAFKPMAGAVALVEFTPASGEMRIRATPQVASADAPTGSVISRPLVDAEKEIDREWRNAVAGVPRPDASRLEKEAVELSIDVDMTLELNRRDASSPELGEPLFRGDIHGTSTGH